MIPMLEVLYYSTSIRSGLCQLNMHIFKLECTVHITTYFPFLVDPQVWRLPSMTMAAWCRPQETVLLLIHCELSDSESSDWRRKLIITNTTKKLYMSINQTSLMVSSLTQSLGTGDETLNATDMESICYQVL